MGLFDLHIHSCYSNDGQYSPRELMSFCLLKGIKIAAVADHNTTRGIQETEKWASLLEITCIPAIELDCTFQNVNLHILGYFIDPSNVGFQKIEQDILAQEQAAAEKQIRLVTDMGIPIDPAIVYGLAHHGVITGEIIAEAALQQKDLEDNPLLLPYRLGGNRSNNPYVNFYWDFCSQGKAAYVPIQYIKLAEAVNLIQSTGGIAVLAHPGNNIKENKKLLYGIMGAGVSGIEVFSSYHSAEQTAFYYQEAKALQALITCGSDFHGKTKPSIQIGSVGCGKLEQKLVDKLFSVCSR